VRILCTLLQLYVYVLFARIILSWFPISPQSPMASVFSVLYTATEPVLGPVRRILPPVGLGGMGLDLSPLIVTVGIQFLLIPLLGC
jgi:YggT family protein